jgi:uncharacterized protein
VGRKIHVKIGPEVEIQVINHCGRCVMTTLAQGDLPKDPGVLRTAAKHNEVRVGIYASVTRPGMVRVGDMVSVQYHLIHCAQASKM